MVNWDEPYNWNMNDIKGKAKLFDHVFVCSSEKLNEYIQNGTKKAHLLYPGYDTSVYYPLDLKKYKCDISICCTNLYIGYPNQYVDRNVLIDDIYNNQNKYGYTFHIYGPKSFKDLYPRSYQGYAKYSDGNNIYNSSRINLCTHVQYNANEYLNERAINILGAGGLLLVDRVTGIDKLLEGKCVFIDKEGYVHQIVDILKHYNKYIPIKEAAYEHSKKYTWDKWGEYILDNLDD